MKKKKIQNSLLNIVRSEYTVACVGWKKVKHCYLHSYMYVDSGLKMDRCSSAQMNKLFENKALLNLYHKTSKI